MKKTLQNIKRIVGEGNLSQAFQALLKRLPANHKAQYENDFTLLGNQFYRLQNSLNLGLISFADFWVPKNQIVHSFLTKIDELGNTVASEKQEKKI